VTEQGRALRPRGVGSPFYGFPLMRLEEVVAAAAMSIRTLPDRQLRAEREALRGECAGAIGMRPAAVLLTLYDTEIARRGGCAP
jgi:hypothetical protein